MTYTQAERLWASCRNAEKGKPIANNTRLFKNEQGNFIIRLHHTDIITITPDNIYVLRSGGWHTITTKTRINDFSPARIFQKNYEWFHGGTSFFENMAINKYGEVVSSPNHV